MIETEDFDKERLLGLLGAFIKVADSDLVDNRRCFPCQKEDHENYKDVRDCFKVIYDEADVTCTNKFRLDMEGKSAQYIQVKSRMLSDPIKKNAHREELLDMLCSMATIDEAKDHINSQHAELYEQAVESLGRCRDT